MKKVMVFIVVLAAAIVVGVTAASLFAPKSPPPVLDAGSVDVPSAAGSDDSEQTAPSAAPSPT
jgi:hypothetical protein